MDRRIGKDKRNNKGATKLYSDELRAELKMVYLTQRALGYRNYSETVALLSRKFGITPNQVAYLLH